MLFPLLIVVPCDAEAINALMPISHCIKESRRSKLRRSDPAPIQVADQGSLRQIKKLADSYKNLAHCDGNAGARDRPKVEWAGWRQGSPLGIRTPFERRVRPTRFG